jgi:hypothetical protein
VRGGGGVKYFIFRNFAVGGEGVLALGPSFVHDRYPYYGGDTRFYVALDLLGGIEFIF